MLLKKSTSMKACVDQTHAGRDALRRDRSTPLLQKRDERAAEGIVGRGIGAFRR
jgi:hypothetical protein